MATAPPSTSSSSSHIDIDQQTEEMPTVDALTTPIVTHPAVRRQAETLRKLKEQEQQIADQQAQLLSELQEINFSMPGL